jgi:hypothetical protein
MPRLGIKSGLVPAPVASGPQYGILAPTNNNTGPGPTLFAFTGSALIPFAPATYIFNVYFNQEAGYYTTFFYDRNDWNGDYGNAVQANSYFGCHPYPYTTGVGATGASGTDHHWEVSAEGTDTPITLGGVDSNGNSTLVTTGQWFRQAVRVTLVGGKPLIEFFWDIGTGMTRLISKQFDGVANTGSNPGLAFLATPWTAPQTFSTIETMDGILRNLQQYPSALSNANIQAASACNYDSQIAALGLGAWYYNANPKPTDITDKSGNAHHPAWVDSRYTGTLWTGP